MCRSALERDGVFSKKFLGSLGFSRINWNGNWFRGPGILVRNCCGFLDWICKTCSYRFMWLITKKKQPDDLDTNQSTNCFSNFHSCWIVTWKTSRFLEKNKPKKRGEFQTIENRFDVLKSCFLRMSANSSNFQVMVEGWGVRFVRICVMSRFFSLKTTKSQIEGVLYLFSFGNVGWWKNNRNYSIRTTNICMYAIYKYQ